MCSDEASRVSDSSIWTKLNWLEKTGEMQSTVSCIQYVSYVDTNSVSNTFVSAGYGLTKARLYLSRRLCKCCLKGYNLSVHSLPHISIKQYSGQAKVNMKAKIVFNVCRLFFDPFHFFDLFRFRVRFCLV